VPVILRRPTPGQGRPYRPLPGRHHVRLSTGADLKNARPQPL
ncbi:MAG: hypothetical protein AVDCRST_MAG90-398, partial [uncultured Microvirga sp.]